MVNDKAPETKVTAATIATYLLSVGGLAIVEAAADIEILPFLPDWLQVLVAPLVPAIVTAVTGYLAPHTERIAP